MTETTNYKLKKPGYEDYVDIGALNANADVIDAELHKLNAGKSDTVKPSEAGNLAALAADGKLQDSGRKPGEKNGVATLDENGHIPGDQLPNSFLPLKGGTMSGPINMNGQRITGLPKPEAESDPMRKDDGASAATLGLYGLGADSTVDDVLKKLTEAAFIKTEENTMVTKLSDLNDDDRFEIEGKKFRVLSKTYNQDGSSGVLVQVYGLSAEYKVAWANSDTDKYEGSALDTTLTSRVFNYLPDSIKSSAIETNVKVFDVYATSLGSTTKIIKRKIFAPSAQYFQDGNYGDGTFIRNIRGIKGEVHEKAWTRTPANGRTEARAYSNMNSDSNIYENTEQKSYSALPFACILLPQSFVVKSVTTPVDTLYSLLTNRKVGTMVETGSYVGNGKVGESYPNSLTFDFEPKIIFLDVSKVDVPNFSPAYFILFRQSESFPVRDSNSDKNTLVWEGNTVKWYSGFFQATADDQFNRAGTIYHYTAIG